MTLHLRDNQIDNLKGLSANMKGLQYLNIRYPAVSQINPFYEIIYNNDDQFFCLCQLEVIKSSMRMHCKVSSLYHKVCRHWSHRRIPWEKPQIIGYAF